MKDRERDKKEKERKKREKKERKLWVKAFGAHLKKVRIKKKMSGAELAMRLYMEKPNITRLEKGRVNPSVYLIKKICVVFEMTMDEFFKDFKKK